MSATIYKFTILLCCSFATSNAWAQEGKIKRFFSLSGPEKGWVLTHPFIAGRTLRASVRAREIAEKQEDSPDLDGFANGGQVDAFRHCFWMASLCQHIKEKKALKLGIAHEEGNEKDFKKRKDEDGDLPDAMANTMDLWNNQVGAMVNRENPGVAEEVLISIVKEAVTSGRCKIIKRNSKGEFVDAGGKAIKREEWHGKWVNTRCLVESDKIDN